MNIGGVNIGFLGIQGKYKTGLAVAYCEYMYACGYKIISLVNMPYIGVKKLSVAEFKLKLTHFAEPEYEHTIWFGDELDSWLIGRNYSDKEQTKLCTPMWQDRHQDSGFVWVAHVKDNPITKIQRGLPIRDILDDSTGVDKIIRDVTRIAVYPEYCPESDTVQYYYHDYRIDQPCWGYLNQPASSLFGHWASTGRESMVI